MEENSSPLYLQQCWRPRGVFEVPHLGDVTAQAPVHTAALVTDQDPPVYGCPARICKRSHPLKHRKQHDLGLQKQSLKRAALHFNHPCLATVWACEHHSLAGALDAGKMGNASPGTHGGCGIPRTVRRFAVEIWGKAPLLAVLLVKMLSFLNITGHWIYHHAEVLYLLFCGLPQKYS